MRIAFDIGGVLSKYPDTFKELISSLGQNIEVFVITDMHKKEEVVKMLSDNGFNFNTDNIFCADYTNKGEMCKAILLKELKIDMFFDDFVGYLQWDSALGPAPIRLLVAPDAFRPYWHNNWIVQDNFDFGRRVSYLNDLKEKG